MQSTKTKTTHKDIIIMLVLITSITVSVLSIFMSNHLQRRQEQLLTIITQQGLLRDAKFECLKNKQDIDSCNTVKETKKFLDEAYKRIR